MLKFPEARRFVVRIVVVLALASMLGGCNRNAAEFASLKADNERLRTEIANLRRKSSGASDSTATPGKPDGIFEIEDLWSQRFEDNSFRTRQRLADKTLRVTGQLDGVTSESVSISGLGKSRNAEVRANLDKSYAAHIQSGLGALENGVTITVQGKFIYDRMELNEAKIVDKATGTPLMTEQLESFGSVAPVGATPPKNQ